MPSEAGVEAENIFGLLFFRFCSFPFFRIRSSWRWLVRRVNVLFGFHFCRISLVFCLIFCISRISRMVPDGSMVFIGPSRTDWFLSFLLGFFDDFYAWRGFGQFGDISTTSSSPDFSFSWIVCVSLPATFVGRCLFQMFVIIDMIFTDFRGGIFQYFF